MNELMNYFNEMKRMNPNNYKDAIMEFIGDIKDLIKQRNKILTFMIMDFVQENPDMNHEAYKLLEAKDFQIRKLKAEDIDYIESLFVECIERIVSVI